MGNLRIPSVTSNHTCTPLPSPRMQIIGKRERVRVLAGWGEGISYRTVTSSWCETVFRRSLRARSLRALSHRPGGGSSVKNRVQERLFLAQTAPGTVAMSVLHQELADKALPQTGESLEHGLCTRLFFVAKRLSTGGIACPRRRALAMLSANGPWCESGADQSRGQSRCCGLGCHRFGRLALSASRRNGGVYGTGPTSLSQVNQAA